VLAQEARERTGESHVAVAGSLSEMALSGLISRGGDAISAVEAFRAQATPLADSGVDLLVLEMMRSEAVAEPALQATAETGLPVWFGVSIGGIGQSRAPLTIDGTDVSRLLELARGRADAVLIMHTDIDVAGELCRFSEEPGRGRSAPIRTSASGRRPTGSSARYRHKPSPTRLPPGLMTALRFSAAAAESGRRTSQRCGRRWHKPRRTCRGGGTSTGGPRSGASCAPSRSRQSTNRDAK
jgi:hypothetical protein